MTGTFLAPEPPTGAWKRVEQIGDCTLYLGDCLEVMPALGKVDAVVTDPPYGISQEAWDKCLPLEWFGLALDHIDDTGAAYVFGDAITLSRFQIYWERRDIIWKARISWIYEDGPRNSAAWTSKHEDCLFYGGRNHKLITPKEPSIHKDKRWGDDRLIGDVWKRQRVLGNYQERSAHPTQKPVSVMELPVVASVRKGGIVFDPFMGSGTTGVACVKTGRKFIGIELDPDYFEIACRRIREAYAQPDMFIETERARPEQLDAFKEAAE